MIENIFTSSAQGNIINRLQMLIFHKQILDSDISVSVIVHPDLEFWT